MTLKEFWNNNEGCWGVVSYNCYGSIEAMVSKWRAKLWIVLVWIEVELIPKEWMNLYSSDETEDMCLLGVFVLKDVTGVSGDFQFLLYSPECRHAVPHEILQKTLQQVSQSRNSQGPFTNSIP